MPVPNVPTDIAMVDPEADPVVYYKRGQVIAIGINAMNWVNARDGSRQISILRERDTDPAFLFELEEDALSVVEEAQAAQPKPLDVQLNHAFRAHSGGPVSDPCCDGNPHGIFNVTATPYRASPYRASSSPNETSAEIPLPADVGGRVFSTTTLAKRPIVRIIDTGLSIDTVTTPLTNPGLGLAIDGARTDDPDEAAPPNKIDPVAGHGTFIAGIIEQLSPGCTIWISDVMDTTGFVSEGDVAAEIHALVDDGNSNDSVRTVLNLSFGGGLHTTATTEVERSIQKARNAGVVVVASAGNEKSCKPFYPANFGGVVAVGALDSLGHPAEFTNRGSWVDACALGVDIISTFFHWPLVPNPDFKGWAVWSGTSFAGPVVVAAIANQMVGDADMSAETALSEVLKGTITVQCLGKRVDPGGFSAAIAV